MEGRMDGFCGECRVCFCAECCQCSLSMFSFYFSLLFFFERWLGAPEWGEALTNYRSVKRLVS